MITCIISFISLFVTTFDNDEEFLVSLLKGLFFTSKIVSEMILWLAWLSTTFAICIAALSDFLKIGINPSNCTILNSWDFENFILADEFVKASRILELYVLANNDLCGKFVSSLESPTTFDERFKVTSVPFFDS